MLTPVQQLGDPRSVAVVVNEAARRGTGALRHATRALERRGAVVTAAHAVRSGAALRARLEEVVGGDHDVVAVGGGDGSLSAAAALLAHSRSALGVLPLGTANDLARTLHVPLGLEAACEAVATGRVVDVDLGRADGRAFVNVASAGLSVGVTEALDPRLKRRLGRSAYGVAVLRAYRRHQPFTARLEFPDGDRGPLEWHDLLQVAVANGRHHGGGNAASPTASIDDDLLDVYAIHSAGVREHVRIARTLKDGTFVAHPSVEHLTTRRLRLVTEPTTPLNLDGEVTGVTPTTFAVERNALHVVVPNDSTAATFDGGSDRRGRRPAAPRGSRRPATAE